MKEKGRIAIFSFLAASLLTSVCTGIGPSTAAPEFSIVYGTYPENDVQIAMLTRPILQVLIDFVSHFDVPETDLAEGRVFGLQRTPEQERMFPPLFTVRCGSSAPGNAYVSVKYREHWFWIEDRDRQSKQVFNFIMFLFSLTETGTPQAAPIVTVPAR